MRAVGPAAANSLFSLSIEKGYLQGQLVYYVLVVISGAALALATHLPQQIWTDQRNFRWWTSYVTITNHASVVFDFFLAMNQVYYIYMWPICSCKCDMRWNIISQFEEIRKKNVVSISWVCECRIEVWFRIHAFELWSPGWRGYVLSNLPGTGPSYSTFVQDGNLSISYYRFALVLSILLCLALRWSLTRIIRLNVLNFQGLLHRRCYHTFKLNSDSSIKWLTYVQWALWELRS